MIVAVCLFVFVASASRSESHDFKPQPWWKKLELHTRVIDLFVSGGRRGILTVHDVDRVFRCAVLPFSSIIHL